MHLNGVEHNLVSSADRILQRGNSVTQASIAKIEHLKVKLTTVAVRGVSDRLLPYLAPHFLRMSKCRPNKKSALVHAKNVRTNLTVGCILICKLNYCILWVRCIVRPYGDFYKVPN